MKEITVIVKGGTVQDVTGIPTDCRVTIIDYDIPGGGYITGWDQDGKPCYISEWNHEV